MEVGNTIGKDVQEIRNFVDILVKEPLNYFVSNDEIRPQDYITRLPYPGKIQGDEIIRKEQANHLKNGTQLWIN
ncbi:MAG: hypothetical protein QXX95_08550 [Nitrososphaerales archaeon]